MTFTKFATYRHRNCLDVDLLIIKVQYVGPSYTKMRVEYVLRNGAMLGCGETVKVVKEQYENWRRVS